MPYDDSYSVNYPQAPLPGAMPEAKLMPQSDKDSILEPEPGDEILSVEVNNGKSLDANVDNNTPAHGTGGIAHLYGPRNTGRP